MSLTQIQDQIKYEERKQNIKALMAKCTVICLKRIIRNKNHFDPDLVIACYFELKGRGIKP